MYIQIIFIKKIIKDNYTFNNRTTDERTQLIELHHNIYIDQKPIIHKCVAF